MSAAESILHTLAELVAAKLADRLPRAVPSEFVDQETCGFDRKLFVRAARAGEFKAAKVGRRWIATRADVVAWLDTKRPKLRLVNDTDVNDMRRRYGLVGGSKRGA